MKKFMTLCLTVTMAIVTSDLMAQTPNLPVDQKLETDYTVKPVSYCDVKLTDSFWAPRQETNRKTSIPHAFDMCEQTGRINNFLVAANATLQDRKPILWETDVFKAIEAASFELAINPNPEMSKYLDRLICIIGVAQESDGYLYVKCSHNRDFTKFNPTSEGMRWHNLRWSHELYTAGHLYEAAIAHYKATGQTNFYDMAVKNVELICKTFGPNKGQIADVPGHEEIELALVKFYRMTGDKKYLNLAKYFVDMRGRADKRHSLAPNPHALYGSYAQDAKPFVEESEAVGHAVRALYLYIGATDVAALTKDKPIADALHRIWDNVVSKKIYITGGLGGTPYGEAFAAEYVLNNFVGYSETCAQTSGCVWYQRMFQLDPDAKYYDVMEQTLYNAYISGVSLTGNKFFYRNELASRGTADRVPWLDCSCCPPNLMRLLATLSGYVYATDENNLYVGLYIANKATAKVGEKVVNLEMTGNYPWSGDVTLLVNPTESESEFCLNLRIPAWLSQHPFASDLYTYIDGKTYQPTISVNGTPVEIKTEKGFVKINRVWKQGDKVELHFPLQPRWVKAHQNVKDCAGRVALTYGPIVYTFEGWDNAEHVFDVFVNPESKVTVGQFDAKYLGGIIKMKVQGTVPQYRTADKMGKCQTVELTAVPYCVWNNRDKGFMQIWMPDNAQLTDQPEAP